MPRTRQELESLEYQTLAPYAQKSGDSRGRKYKEPSPAWRTEYQRGVLFKDREVWKVRTTGQQGSGVLRSMSEANCFIVLEHERASVKAGEPVSVQLFEGLA